MPSLHTYLLYCGVYAIALAVPGPGIVAIVARALGGGFRSTIPAVAGTVVGDWVLMSLSVFGLGLVAQAAGGFFLVMKLTGAAYLVYLAYRHWTAPVADLGAVVPTAARQSFVSQLSLTLGNPKAIAFFVALLPSVVNLKHVSVLSYLGLSAATFTLIPATELTYAALASRMRGLLASRQALRRVNQTAAVVLAGAGIGVALT